EVAARLTEQTAALERFRADLNARYFIKAKPDGSGSILWSRDLRVQEEEVKREEALWAKQKDEVDSLGARCIKHGVLKRKETAMEDDKRRFMSKIEGLESEIRMAQFMVIVEPGSHA